MIRNLFVRNLQGHRDSYLEFAPGVNVIKGQSFAGKSSLIRGFNLVIHNRPFGDDLVNWDSEKDPMEAGITVQNGQGPGEVVTRRRDVRNNAYVISDEFGEDESIFKALRGAVPQEVLDALKMNDINISGQDDPYFMLRNTAGERARKFNEVLGLEVIDKLLSIIIGYVQTASHKVNMLDEESLQLAKEIEALQWVSLAEKKVNSIQKLADTVNEKTKDIEVLESILLGIRQSAAAMIENKRRAKILPTVIELIEEFNKIQSRIKDNTTLYNVIVTTRAEENRTKEFKKKVLPMDEIIEMTETAGEIEEMERRNIKLGELIAKVRFSEEEVAERKDYSEKAHKVFHHKLEQAGVCPLCGSTIGGEK